MNKIKRFLKKLFKPTPVNKYRFIVTDGRRSPEMIMVTRKYLKDFNPSVEKINGEITLILNIRRESMLEKIKNKNFEFDHSTTQVIYDTKYIQGINGFIYIIR